MKFGLLPLILILIVVVCLFKIGDLAIDFQNQQNNFTSITSAIVSHDGSTIVLIYRYDQLDVFDDQLKHRKTIRLDLPGEEGVGGLAFASDDPNTVFFTHSHDSLRSSMNFDRKLQFETLSRVDLETGQVESIWNSKGISPFDGRHFGLNDYFHFIDSGKLYFCLSTDAPNFQSLEIPKTLSTNRKESIERVIVAANGHFVILVEQYEDVPATATQAWHLVNLKTETISRIHPPEFESEDGVMMTQLSPDAKYLAVIKNDFSWDGYAIEMATRKVIYNFEFDGPFGYSAFGNWLACAQEGSNRVFLFDCDNQKSFDFLTTAGYPIGFDQPFEFTQILFFPDHDRVLKITDLDDMQYQKLAVPEAEIWDLKSQSRIVRRKLQSANDRYAFFYYAIVLAIGAWLSNMKGTFRLRKNVARKPFQNKWFDRFVVVGSRGWALCFGIGLFVLGHVFLFPPAFQEVFSDDFDSAARLVSIGMANLLIGWIFVAMSLGGIRDRLSTRTEHVGRDDSAI